MAFVAAGATPPGLAQDLEPQAEVGQSMIDDLGSLAGFEAWRAAFRPRALARGVLPDLFDQAMAQARLLPEVIARDRKQDEFAKTIWDYLDKAVSQERIAAGQRALRKNAALFAQIEARYKVDKYTVLAIWGLESAYGALRGDIDTLSALATLSYEGRRAAFFEAELLALLTILQDGAARPAQLRGSWAGAMGHTQFMPSSYARLAVDFNGDGSRNIWDDDPTDALASAAAYLAEAGWVPGQAWGQELRLPAGFDTDLAGSRTQRPMAFWRGLGVVAAGGATLPESLWGAVILPAGARGPAFMVYDNFAAIERYNKADAYVIAVGHLSDRLRGQPDFAQAWPRDLRALTLPEKIEMQQLLLARGLMSGAADGKIGPLTVAAVKAFQRSRGLVPDGYPCLPVLAALRVP